MLILKLTVTTTILLFLAGCGGGGGTLPEQPQPPIDEIIWAKSAVGNSADRGFAITTLSDDSTVVTGYFCSYLTSSTFDYAYVGPSIFGTGELNETQLNSAGGRDMFIARYAPNGSLAWAESAGGEYGFDLEGNAITTLSDDSSIVTGYFDSIAAFAEGKPNQTVLNSEGERDIFIARYNSDGALVWVKRAGGPSHDIGTAITSLTDDSTVLSGNFTETATFGSGELNETVLHASTGSTIFIARYNPDGTLVWAKQADGSTWGSAVESLSDNSIIVTGLLWETTTFGKGEPNETILHPTGGYDMFIARYSLNGSLVWVKRAGGQTNIEATEITTLSDNSTVLTGYFSATVTFGENETNQTVLESVDNNDIFIARYNTNGTLLLAKRAGGLGNDAGYGITTLSDNSTVVTGYFRQTATFDENGPNEVILTGNGLDDDIFIARFLQ